MTQKLSDSYKLHLNKGKDHVYGGLNIFCNKHYGSDEVGKKTVVEKNGKKLAVLTLASSYKVDEALAAKIKFLFNVDVVKDTYLNVRASVFSNLATRFDNVTIGEGDYLALYASNVKLEEYSKKDGSKGYQLSATCFDFEVRNRSNKTATPAATAPATTADVIDFSEDDLPF